MSSVNSAFSKKLRPSFFKSLRLRWLWLAHAYSFNWAHKPLCDRFNVDVLRFNFAGRKINVCRSCTLLYAALIFTAPLLLACRIAGFDNLLRSYGPVAYVGLGTAVIGLSLPAWYKRWPRLMRDFLRAGIGVLLALTVYLLTTSFWWVGGMGAAGMYGFWKLYGHHRSHRKQNACSGCHEYGTSQVCSGFVAQADLLRAYESKATELLNQP